MDKELTHDEFLTMLDKEAKIHEKAASYFRELEKIDKNTGETFSFAYPNPNAITIKVNANHSVEKLSQLKEKMGVA